MKCSIGNENDDGGDNHAAIHTDHEDDYHGDVGSDEYIASSQNN